MDYKPAVHFVRFTKLYDQTWYNAVRIWGQPDFVHRGWDSRAQREIAEGDTIVFAKGDSNQPLSPYVYDDSAYAEYAC
jgi:hypothetical protein